jgi:hypothetical protein
MGSRDFFAPNLSPAISGGTSADKDMDMIPYIGVTVGVLLWYVVVHWAVHYGEDEWGE